MALIYMGMGFGLLFGLGIYLLIIRPAVRERRRARKPGDDG